MEANFVENLNNLMNQLTGKAISTADIPLENMYKLFSDEIQSNCEQNKR